ncbi:hypothetical protein F5Y01DRAFT_327088 [Xylaria sp. FL0043]|nr:hypothetical protein F5Y01DRAFT_327088 [Xylaria sp. FL0043]
MGCLALRTRARVLLLLPHFFAPTNVAFSGSREVSSPYTTHLGPTPHGRSPLEDLRTLDPEEPSMGMSMDSFEPWASGRPYLLSTPPSDAAVSRTVYGALQGPVGAHAAPPKRLTNRAFKLCICNWTGFPSLRTRQYASYKRGLKSTAFECEMMFMRGIPNEDRRQHTRRVFSQNAKEAANVISSSDFEF